MEGPSIPAIYSKSRSVLILALNILSPIYCKRCCLRVSTPGGLKEVYRGGPGHPGHLLFEQFRSQLGPRHSLPQPLATGANSGILECLLCLGATALDAARRVLCLGATALDAARRVLCLGATTGFAKMRERDWRLGVMDKAWPTDPVSRGQAQALAGGP